MQTCTYIPIFLFFCNLFMAGCACTLAALVVLFCLGRGSAFMRPAWQAAMSGLVEPDEMEAAATLNNLSYNTAAIIGPAPGGALFKWIGLLAIYRAWWRDDRTHVKPCADYGARLREGVSTAIGCPCSCATCCAWTPACSAP